jgi:tRNA pseudouridine55 synthase
VRISVDCSKGTYIRSLAHELGQKLGCGAHLYSLVRTRVGRFRIEDSLTLTRIAARKKLGLLDDVVIRLPELLDVPSLTVPDSIHVNVRNGRDIHCKDIERFSAEFAEGDRVAVVGREGQLLAVGEALAASARFGANNLVDQPVFKYMRVL